MRTTIYLLITAIVLLGGWILSMSVKAEQLAGVDPTACIGATECGPGPSPTLKGVDPTASTLTK